MNKKSYIQPSIKAIPIVQTEIICGSGKTNSTLGSGDPNDKPKANGNGIIFGDAKESFFDDEDYDDEW